MVLQKLLYSPKEEELNDLVIDFGEDLRLFEQKIHYIMYFT